VLPHRRAFAEPPLRRAFAEPPLRRAFAEPPERHLSLWATLRRRIHVMARSAAAA
jgi:hypothetical protein